MKYYWLHHACVSVDDPFVTCDPPFGSEWTDGICWNLGEPIEKGLPIPIIYDMDRELALNDYLYTTMSQFLVSSTFMKVIEEYSSDFASYKSEVHWDGSLVSDDYWTLNFETTYACMDWEASTYIKDADFPTRVRRLKRLVLDISKLPQETHLFMLHEDTSKILVSEDFKLRCETAMFSGVDFIDFSDYIFPY